MWLDIPSKVNRNEPIDISHVCDSDPVTEIDWQVMSANSNSVAYNENLATGQFEFPIVEGLYTEDENINDTFFGNSGSNLNGNCNAPLHFNEYLPNETYYMISRVRANDTYEYEVQTFEVYDPFGVAVNLFVIGAMLYLAGSMWRVVVKPSWREVVDM